MDEGGTGCSTTDILPSRSALRSVSKTVSYSELWSAARRVACALEERGVRCGERVAIWLPNSVEFVVAIYATSLLGAVFVPISATMRRRQVRHIVQDCSPSVLITTTMRASRLIEIVENAPFLIVTAESDSGTVDPEAAKDAVVVDWMQLEKDGNSRLSEFTGSDDSLAALLYTSGSTGLPMGVMVSHGNLVAGATTVAGYLHNNQSDRIAAAVPFSFDYGLSQLTTAVSVGAEVVITGYSLPATMISDVARYGITGLAGVPNMWIQLSRQDWGEKARQSLRYITNSGGRLPTQVVGELQRKLGSAKIFLMYGLTEAFRSTYLDPAELPQRSDSIGKPVPGERLFVLRKDSSECSPMERGELVHYGHLVTKGYWKRAEDTARRFRDLPGRLIGNGGEKTGVWTGDIGFVDHDGFYYFVERTDAQIKSSGYRISPTEIEDVVASCGGIKDVVAVGVPSPETGQEVGLAVATDADSVMVERAIRRACAAELPPHMQPNAIRIYVDLPRLHNQKTDRAAIMSDLEQIQARRARP